jgi:hypothetical protein
METIFIILRELEYFEGIMKWARKKKDIKATQTQVVVIMDTPTMRHVATPL